MPYRDQILQRIAYLQAELAALAHLAELEFASEATSPAPAPAPAPTPAPVATPAAAAAPAPKAASAPKKKVRWSYKPGTHYRIVGDNPFRNGNNRNLFAYLANRFGDAPFSREQLGEAIGTLARKGKIDTVQSEETFVMVFLRAAGAVKGRIEMSEAPQGGSKPKVSVEDALPPEPGEVGWTLSGKPSFHKGSINNTLWNALQSVTFSRDELNGKVAEMLASGAISSSRSAELIARDFMGKVVDKGLAHPAEG